MTTIAVTGASGMLGRYLVADLVRRGHQVRALVRDPADFARRHPGVPALRCDLPSTIDPHAFTSVDVLIHAAYATKETNLAQARRVNETGTGRLVEVARTAGVGRLIFVSTIAAHAAAPSYYALSKHRLEAAFTGKDDLIIRPGLILAREGTGLFQQMREIVRRLRVVPLFGGGRQPLQTVYVEDVCAAIAAGIDRGLPGTLNVAEPNPLNMREFFRMLAECLGVRCIYLPLPFGPVLAAVRAAEAVHLPLPLKSESLLGLQGLRRVEVATDIARLGLTPRSAAESIPLCA